MKEAESLTATTKKENPKLGKAKDLTTIGETPRQGRMSRCWRTTPS